MCVVIAAWELSHGDNNLHWLTSAMVLLILTGHDLTDPYELTNIIFTQSQSYCKFKMNGGKRVQLGLELDGPIQRFVLIGCFRDALTSGRQSLSFGCRFRRLLCRRPTSFLFPYFPIPCPTSKLPAFSHSPSDISLQTVVG